MGTTDEADFPIASYEYGHKIDRAERSAELYRIGGLMDQIDAQAILAEMFAEIGADAERADRLAAAALARLASAPDHPILACRVYEAGDPTPQEG